MSFDYYSRIRMGIGLLIFFALLSNLQSFINSPKFELSKVGQDDVTLYLKRYDAIRGLLPEHGTVGYAGGGLNYAEYWNSDAGALRSWFLTQYALAPVVVSITANHKVSIINSRGGGTDSTSPENAGRNVRDLGNGMTLYDFEDGLRVVVTQ